MEAGRSGPASIGEQVSIRDAGGYFPPSREPVVRAVHTDLVAAGGHYARLFATWDGGLGRSDGGELLPSS